MNTYITQARAAIDQIEAYGDVDDSWALGIMCSVAHTLKDLALYLKRRERVQAELVEETSATHE